MDLAQLLQQFGDAAITLVFIAFLIKQNGDYFQRVKELEDERARDLKWFAELQWRVPQRPEGDTNPAIVARRNSPPSMRPVRRSEMKDPDEMLK
jgi:hypothetical protein